MADVEPGTEILADGALHTDTRHFPVVFLSWHGPSSVATVDACRDWLDRMAARAAEGSTQFYLINDTSDSERPGPETRKALSKLVHHLYEHRREHLLGGAVIVPSALLRATFIMVKALSRRDVGFRPVKDMGLALESAFAALREAGIERPTSLERLLRERSAG